MHLCLQEIAAKTAGAAMFACVFANARAHTHTHTHTHTHAAAFSVGNLKHRNLQGQEVCSQVLATLSRVA